MVDERRRELVEVPLDQVVISALNARKDLDAGTEDAGVADLAKSIEVVGLISPPTLRQMADGRYEVIAGQRRVLACRLLKRSVITAFVEAQDDTAALGLSLVENVQRADMHPSDKARALADLVERTGSEQEASRVTGLGLRTVRRYLQVLALPEDIRRHLGTGDGPSGVGAMSALANAFTDPDEQREAWERLKGFKGNEAEKIFRQSNGDMGALEDLREQALRGNFGIERCGTSLLECPWLGEMSERAQQRVMTAMGPSDE